MKTTLTRTDIRRGDIVSNYHYIRWQYRVVEVPVLSNGSVKPGIEQPLWQIGNSSY